MTLPRLLTMCAIALPFLATAQTAVTIDVTTPGSLPELIGEDAKMEIQSLTVTGDLNGKDIAFIREMGKGEMDYTTWQWNSNLTALDLSGANIIAGEEPYINSYPYPVTEEGVIGEDMFSKFAALTELKLPETATRLCKRALDGNSKLTGLTLPSSLKTIEKWSVYYNTALTELTIPSNVELIEETAFFGSGIEKIVIESSSILLEQGAFAGLSMLTDIEAAENNESFSSVGGVLFSKDLSELILYPGGRKNLSYSIPEGVVSVADYAFYGNTNIAGLTMPEGVTTLGNYAFDGCTALYPIEFPASLESIGDYTFTGCSQFTSLDLSNTSVTSIGDYAWGGVTGLNEIILSPVLETVGAYAFPSGYCTTLTLPATLKSIGQNGFAMMSLEKVYAEGETPAECDGDVFAQELKMSLGMEMNGVLYVPAGCSEAYRQANGFKYFNTIIDDDESAGIEVIPSESVNGQSKYYDLNGRHINNPSGAIYIEITPDGKVRKIAK